LVENRDNEEYPLLFNPALDDPDSLFSYINMNLGNDGYLLIIPSESIVDARQLDKAKYSISTLGLNHPVIAKARLDKVISCKLAIGELEGMLERNIDPLNMKKVILGILDYISLNRNSSFIGLCRRLSREVIHRTKVYIVQRSNNQLDQATDSMDEVISFLEEYCRDFEVDYDIGLIC